MPISNNHELYEVVREAVEVLRDAGASELASDLQLALTISSMPGEILGEIRLVLRRIRSHPSYERIDVRRRVDDGMQYLDRALDG
jgi:hypothetical protein